MKNKEYWIIGIVLAIFIITNPSRNDCASYCGTKITEISRKWNFFVFSVYSFKNDYVSADGAVYGSKKYIGVLGNFFNITPKPWEPPLTDRLVDSTKMSDSSKMKMADTTQMTDTPFVKPQRKVDEYGIPIKSKKG